MPTQTGSIDFKSTKGFQSYASGQYATLAQVKGQFATCSTAAATQAKAATIVPTDTGWELYTGATITVRFTADNTHATPTLNVNSTGAKSIRDHTGTALTEEAYKWKAGDALAFTYDGTYWRMQDTLAQRVTTNKTAIEQNASDILLRATKTEAAQMAQPNLAPIGSVDFSNLYNATTNPDGYWRSTPSSWFTQLEDGWVHCYMDNTSGTAATNTTSWRPSPSPSVEAGKVYTILTEIRNNHSSGSSQTDMYLQQIANNQFWGDINGVTIDDDHVTTTTNISLRSCGETYVRYSYRIADTEHLTTDPVELFRYNFRLPAGGKFDFDFRQSVYEGIYDGPYKPYAGQQLYASKAELKVTADGITSTVSSIASAKYVNSTTASWPLASLKTYAAEGHSENWNVTSTDGLRVGDTVYVKGTDSTRNCTVYIKTTVTAVNSATNFTGTSHGYEDVLPVDTVKSTINQSSDSVKIEARHVDIVGATIFTTGRLSELSLNNAYDAKGAAADAVNNLEIGGRNLLINTGNYATWDSTAQATYIVRNSDCVKFVAPSSSNWWTLEAHNAYIPLADWDTSATYTVSIDVKFDNFKSMPQYPRVAIESVANNTTVGYTARVNEIGFDVIPTTNDWTHFEWTFDGDYSTWNSPGSGTPAYVKVLIWLYLNSSHADAVSFRNLKLEKGNKATDWSPAPEDATAEALASGIEYIEGTQTAATNLWTGVTKETALVAGKSIAYKLTYAGTSTAATLNLTLAGGGTTGAKAVKMVYSTSSNTGALSNVTTHWPANSIIQMTYDGTQWVISNYNTNVDDKNARNVRFYNTIVAGEALNAASIIGMHADGKFYQVKENATFLLSAPLLWLTTAKAAAATNADAIYTHAYDVNLATYYTSFVNTKNNCTVYLVGTVNGNTFSTYGSSSAQYLTVTEPTTEDGRFYIPLGRLSNTSTGKNYFNYVVDYPVSLYAYLDGRFRQVTPTEIVASHRVYYRTDTATSSLAAPTSWVTEATGNVYNAWTTKVPPLAVSTESGQQKYLFLYTCEQRRRLDGTIKCTGVQLDENTTVIDGGRIITGSVTANQLSANAVTADKIAAGALTLGKFKDTDKLLVDNSQVQVGGRNLLLGTSESIQLTTTTSDTNKTAYYTLSDYGYSAVHSSGTSTVMVSFDWETTGTSGTIRVQVNATPWSSQLAETVSSSLQSGHASLTWTVPSTWATSTFTGFGVRLDNIGGTTVIKNFKLELGNKGTDWSPAPEDQTGYVDSSVGSVATDLSQLSGDLGVLSDNLTNATGEIGELKKQVSSLAGDVEGLTATTQWLSFNANDGLTIGDSDNFFTQQKGSEMTFNQVANGTLVELMSLSGTNGIMGPRVTVTDQISTPRMVSENWAISLSGDMFSIDYIGE